MPLPGGASDKFGNRYEGKWTVACMADVIDERAESIRLEPPGLEGEGIEFTLLKDDCVEYHQVKRQRAPGGYWTFAALATSGVLTAIKEKANAPGSCFVFVSMQDAPQLRELAERAGNAQSFDEFTQEFLKPDHLRNEFSQLRDRWGGSETEAFEILCGCRVDVIGEGVLYRLVEARLAPLVEGEPSNITDVLAQFALDSIHHELTAHEIWHHLDQRGFRRRSWNNDPHVLSAIDNSTRRFLEREHKKTISGQMLPRDESELTVQHMTSHKGNRGVLLTGEAGSGKSCILAQIIERFRALGWPVVAFRMDTLTPTENPTEIGRQIGLIASPVSVLKAVAQSGDCLLVIDQLDAVSMVSGRNPTFFETANDLIDGALAHDNMHLLIGCRTFDLKNDHRLRRLTADGAYSFKEIAVRRLSEKIVRQVVGRLGIDENRLTIAQLQLLSLPLHLRMFQELSAETKRPAVRLTSAIDLYDAFWREKRALARARLGRPPHWTQVVDALCNSMSDTQRLFAPESTLDDWAEDARVMASEQVLSFDEGHYSFFHETFFDYAFARRFAAHGKDLVSLLAEGEQHLFRRAQVRQVLLHERATDKGKYLHDLRSLLTSDDVRFHLRKIAFELLSQLTDPTIEEWEIIEPFSRDPSDPRMPETWRVLYGSVPWFQLLSQSGLIAGWFEDENQQHVDRTVILSSSLVEQIPDKIATTIGPHIQKSEAWANRVAYLIRRSGLAEGRVFFDMLLHSIEQGLLDEIDDALDMNADVWLMNYSLAKQKPEWACELLGQCLKRRLEISIQNQDVNEFVHDLRYSRGKRHAVDFIQNSAEGAPFQFVQHLLPFIVELSGKTAVRDGSQLPKDGVFEFDHEVYTIGDAILEASAEALRSLARSQPAEMAPVLGQLREAPLLTCAYLAIRAFGSNGLQFGDEALEFVLGLSDDSLALLLTRTPAALTEMLEAASSHCSDDLFYKLVGKILSYYPEIERTAAGKGKRGWSQYVLLRRMSCFRLSKEAKRRLQEWKRKFGEHDLKRTKRTHVESVQSPIPHDRTSLMSDDQWMRAITKYDVDRITIDSQGEFRGGAHQLSEMLYIQAKQNPKRFAELAIRFPENTQSSYFEAVLRAITETELDSGAVLKLCRLCHELPGRPYGRHITRPLTNLSTHPLPDFALKIVRFCALDDPDPDEELWKKETSSGGKYYGGDVWMAGYNSVRGDAAMSIALLISKHSEYLLYFKPVVEQLVQDPSVAVRSCVAKTLMAILGYDRDLAIDLFLRLCDCGDALLTTPPVERFLNAALGTHFPQLRQIADRMLASGVPAAAVVAARQVCGASLWFDEARPLAERCLDAEDAQRAGAAEVFAINLERAGPNSFCAQALSMLFNDPNPEVRAKTARCFESLDPDCLGEYSALISHFVESPAFETSWHSFFASLERSTCQLPEATCFACERFIDLTGSDSGDIRTRASADADTVSKLIVRAYAQSKNLELQCRCLDVIDRMLQAKTLGLDDALSLYDRRL